MTKPFLGITLKTWQQRHNPKKGNKKMTSTTTKKVKPDTTNSTVARLWSDLVVQTTTSEQGAIRACLELAKEMKRSSITVRETMKVVKETGLESPFVKVSHVEGLPTMLSLQKVAGFSALPLAKQLSTATASYKLLGAGIGEQMPSLEALETEIARERKNKNDKKGEAKEAKSPKTNADTLKSILAYFSALDTSTLNESEQNLIAEIEATVSTLMINA
jgi:hypothetical protein